MPGRGLTARLNSGQMAGQNSGAEVRMNLSQLIEAQTAAEQAWQGAAQALDRLAACYRLQPRRAWPLRRAAPAVALLTALWTVGVVEIVQRLG